MRGLAAMQDRGFRWFFLARAITMIAGSMSSIALAFAVLEIDNAPDSLAIVLTIYTLANVVFLIFGGVVADRLPRALVIQTCYVIDILSIGTTAALLFSGTATVPLLALLAAVNGASSAFVMPAMQGIIPQLTTPEHLQQANAMADKAMYKPVEYANRDKKGPALIVIPGEIKSSNATFTQKFTANNIADFGELELSNANFQVLERTSSSAISSSRLARGSSMPARRARSSSTRPRWTAMSPSDGCRSASSAAASVSLATAISVRRVRLVCVMQGRGGVSKSSGKIVGEGHRGIAVVELAAVPVDT